jgi:hypothetical protein
MKSSLLHVRWDLVFLVLVMPALGVSQQSSGSGPSQAAMPPNPCTLPQQKQFDFWVGTWDATWPGAKEGEIAHGSNHITRVLDACVVQESFDGGDSMPLRGMSLSLFDGRTNKWKQTWVDNAGAYLDFVGEFKDRQMILAREAVLPNGTHVQQRMVYKNITASEFDWSWEASQDGGKTWQVQWPIHYKRKL